MKTYSEIPTLTEKTAVALGFFDGLHIAHREVINAVTEQKKKLVPVVLTFDITSSAPQNKLFIKTILTKSQKLAELARLNIEIVVSPDFCEIDSIDATDFFEDILLKKLNAGYISCGFDYKFGYGAKGDVTLLKALCEKHKIELNIIPKLTLNSMTVSSTAIRKALVDGDIPDANRMLGYEYYISSVVEHGEKIGSKIGFPTINQPFSKTQTIPKYGVYKTTAEIGEKTYKSVTSVGIKPTISGDRLPISETHIIDYDEDIYGKCIKVSFEKFLREEIKFPSIEALREQIAKDIDKCR